MIAGATLGIAGCSGGTTGDSNPTPTTDETDDPDDGGSNQPTATQDGGSGDDGGTAGSGSTDTQTDSSGSTPTDSPPSQTTLGAVQTQFETSYRYRVDFSGYEGGDVSMEMTGEWHEGDYHSQTVYQGMTVDMYQVGGQLYMEAGGQCTSVSGAGATPLPDVDTEEFAGTEDTQTNFEQWASLMPTGQQTIDGEAMWEFHVPAGEFGNPESITFFISVDSGYLRRLETQGVVAEYWDWGNVGPIQAPC